MHGEDTKVALEGWLRRATRGLAAASAAKVRAEIQDHYDQARESAVQGGATCDDAARAAFEALGDARQANCQYRLVMLTAAESRALRESAWESQAVCARRTVRRGLALLPVALLVAALAAFHFEQDGAARILCTGSAVFAVLLAPLFLPVFTPVRARFYRAAKWFAMAGFLVVILGSHTLEWTWLLASCMTPGLWIEWTRASLRRKIPVAQWPRHLYL